MNTAAGLTALIEREHWGKRRSIRALEREAGLSNGTLSRRCIAFGIRVRTRTEQTSITNSEFNPNRPAGERHWAYGLRRPECAERMRVDNPMRDYAVRVSASNSMANHARQHLTPPERAIFDVLEPFGAIAQHPIGAFIVDVAFVDLKVAVEVDGKNHWSRDRSVRDIKRDAWIVSQGWRIFRVANSASADPSKLVDVLKKYVANLNTLSLSPVKRRGPKYRVLMRDAEHPTGIEMD